MEPGIREFFKRISLSIGLCIVWMAINIVVGVKYSLAFFDTAIKWSNIVFYIWAIASFIGVIFLYKKIWEKPIENLDD